MMLLMHFPFPHMKCQEEDMDLEAYLTGVQEDMMEFKLSYEMWRVGNWIVTVNNVS